MRLPTQTRRRASRSAFTLLEILIVVAIIVLLAGTGTYYLMQNYESAKAQTAKASVQSLSQQLNIYKLAHDGYPSSLDVLAQPGPNGEKPVVPPEALRDPWGQPYQFDPSGPNNQGAKADVFTKNPQTGQIIGNWGTSK